MEENYFSVDLNRALRIFHHRVILFERLFIEDDYFFMISMKKYQKYIEDRNTKI